MIGIKHWPRMMGGIRTNSVHLCDEMMRSEARFGSAEAYGCTDVIASDSLTLYAE